MVAYLDGLAPYEYYGNYYSCVATQANVSDSDSGWTATVSGLYYARTYNHGGGYTDFWEQKTGGTVHYVIIAISKFGE